MKPILCGRNGKIALTVFIARVTRWTHIFQYRYSTKKYMCYCNDSRNALFALIVHCTVVYPQFELTNSIKSNFLQYV